MKKEQLVESILHMLINFGEHSSYPEKIKSQFHKLTLYFNNVEEGARLYLIGQIYSEVGSHLPEYSQFDIKPEEVIEEAIANLNNNIK